MSSNKIKMFIMDVDGTLTDGKIYMGIDGEEFKAFNSKDGLRIKQLPSFGIIPVIITGRTSRIVENRALELGITEIYQGVSNKVILLDSLLAKFNITYDNVAYIGDDENDISCMEKCILKGCPANAVSKVQEISNYISKYIGGDGAVRDFLDYILRDQLKNRDFNCNY